MRRQKKEEKKRCELYGTIEYGKNGFLSQIKSEFWAMLILAHKKMEVYALSLELTKLIYEITSDFPKSEQFGLSSQLRRAAVSVLSNIAEGSSRASDKEKSRFFEVSRGSLVEMDTQLEISMSLHYCKKERLEELSPIFHQIFAMITGLINKYSKHT